MPMPPQPEAAAAMPFPIFLDLTGQGALVVGGGEEAAAKCRLLLPTGAVIRAVASVPGAALEELAAAGGIMLLRRAFAPEDLDGVRLCYVAVEDAKEAAVVVAEARRRGVLVNAVGRPTLCDFTTPAMLQCGPGSIAIGTEGAAPALARDLRTRIEAAVPSAFGTLAAFCARWRDHVTAALPDRDRRRRLWDDVPEGEEAAILERGDAEGADAAMAARLAGAGAAPRRGRVSLVGAGPGDPELLTLRALRTLSRADVVLYDKLVDPRVLGLARRDARCIDVGKRCGRHAMSQAAINALLVREVRSGAHVVRLKGGDPFVFGRGGEELEALRMAGVEAEVVPGITAALAAAARLRLPLTHRGVARGLHLITAHGADGELPAQDWRALAQASGTLAVYMGARTLPRVTAALIEAGMARDMPAIAVENASLPGERRFPATLAEIACTVAAAGVEGPTLVLIGVAVALADTGATPRHAMMRHAA
ncbi:siroheme synthase CysG [Siccirubricoccus sp. KC 17139]|uniref:Siroheme synthase CysG n=1 Tax=Siccirubricoccus soli TaxID=2899147 RepID=A0ABT1D969_9PROT|nr:siroheme synthase CysG [Siccirubricoccus soli]MCO6418456.1 siroheme synthase CysG [Siccirubricoccus soli]MCP2684591.1 siroheme synthase CysG [Siccirubricoccus soli]